MRRSRMVKLLTLTSILSHRERRQTGGPRRALTYCKPIWQTHD